MINRVFCYSDEEAKRNGNSVSIGKMILQVFGITFIMITIFIICSISLDKLMNNPIFLLLFFSLFFGFFMYYLFEYSFKYRSRLTGFATDTNNNVYCVTKLNNGEDFVIGGMATGGIIDNILKDNNSFAGNLAEGIGTAMTIYSLNKSEKIMQNPEIIARMVECATTTTGAEIKQILKIYNYTQTSHSVKIKCDYRIMRTGKIKYNKNITIYKSFNCFNELMNDILNIRGN